MPEAPGRSPLAWCACGFDRDRPNDLTIGLAVRGRAAGPVPERRLDQRERRNTCGVGPQDPGPEREPKDMWLTQQQSALLPGKPAFGPDQDIDSCGSLSTRQELQRVGDVGCLIAKNKKTFRLAVAEKAVEGDGLCDL